MKNISRRDDATQTNYVQQGSGPPVILAHGLAASLHDWDDLLPALAARGYAAYALDLLGHGESAKPREVSAYTVESVFNHFEAWIDSLALQRPFALIGHSLGSALSLIYARRHPDRVRALVLINPFYDVEQLPAILQSAVLGRFMSTGLIHRTPYRLFRIFVDLASFHNSLGHAEPHVMPQHVRDQTAVDYKRSAPGIYDIPRTLSNGTLDLARVEQPTLLLWGNRDNTLAVETFPRLKQLLPNVVSSHVFPICGHVPHQCHPDLLDPLVLDFLDTLRSAEPPRAAQVK